MHRTRTVNRCFHSIARDILAKCSKGALRAELDLSGKQSKRYLSWAIQHDFLELRNEKLSGRTVKKYYTTKQGHILLMALENVGLIAEDKDLIPVFLLG